MSPPAGTAPSPFHVKQEGSRPNRALHVKRRSRGPVELLRDLFLAPIHAYSRWISPALPARCKYHPTCSAYAIEAVRELGILRGGVLALWRLARCNPWSHGGVDELADRRLFRTAASRSARRSGS